MGVDANAFRAVLGQWPTGVTVVTIADEEQRGQWHGLTASSFGSVSLEPPLVSVCLAHSAFCHDLLAGSGLFGVSILAKDQASVGKAFANPALRGADRFAGEKWTTATTGSPLLANALGWLDCRLRHSYDGGDHTIFVGEVLAADTPRVTSPLLYHSRTWGQFADQLPASVHLFAYDGVPTAQLSAPDDVVAGAVMAASGDVLLCDDGAATPITVREACREAVRAAGSERVIVRLDPASPLAQANLLTALKSGVRRIDIGPRGLPEADVRLLTDSLDLTISEGAR